MNNIRNKFVVTENEIKFGRVEWHRQLDEKAIAGGMWYFDQEKETLYLYGSSGDFGYFTHEQIAERMDSISIKFNGCDDVVIDNNPTSTAIDAFKKRMDPMRAIEIATECDFL